jgi:hypothetical protein
MGVKKIVRKHKQKIVLIIAVLIIAAMVLGSLAGFFLGL